jgi:hypothetical protein
MELEHDIVGTPADCVCSDAEDSDDDGDGDFWMLCARHCPRARHHRISSLNINTRLLIIIFSILILYLFCVVQFAHFVVDHFIFWGCATTWKHPARGEEGYNSNRQMPSPCMLLCSVTGKWAQLDHSSNG